MSTIKPKVYAYITRGTSLLVFHHLDFPEAGIQIVGGTVEPGETIQTAVLREAAEETGLSGLVNPVFLGVQTYSLSAFHREEVHRRHYFHVRLQQNTPTSWRTFETHPSGGASEPIAFEHYWVELATTDPGLIAGLDAFLPQLKARLGL